MVKENTKFRHDSLQDAKTIKTLIEALGDGFAKGKLRLSDEGGALVLEPEGLMTLRIRGERGDDGQCRVDFRVSWTDSTAKPGAAKPPKIGS